MKVLLVNGSPHEHGCTYTALMEISNTLKKEEVESEFFWIGNKPIPGCIACKSCVKNKKCIIDDNVNEFLNISKEFDGFVFGSPVHFASASGAITSFLDRVFYTDLCAGLTSFYLKPAAAIVSARRAGTTTTFDQLNKYFGIMQMPIVTSQYWNMVHGANPDDVVKDLEGLQTMRTLARNMSWFLKCKEAGIKAGIKLPEQEDSIATNFIR